MADLRTATEAIGEHDRRRVHRGEVDIAFHERLVALAGSPRLSRTHQTFITETRMCIHARALANAIHSGDPTKPLYCGGKAPTQLLRRG
ncbi:FCD domain-containing protein [Kribbella qitaiheensis]|uniref:FCD domain-containing protein n=1 Tax=Kribbella qitaiheensis TaxID=1544730 RepID=UPI001CA55C9A|nr:FCD domain-containing protein [Kribbella qitaiheensis]